MRSQLETAPVMDDAVVDIVVDEGHVTGKPG